MTVVKRAVFSKYLVLLFCIFLVIGSPAVVLYSQEGTPRTNDDYMVIGISSRPAMSIPILDSTNYYTVGFGADFSAGFSMPFFPPMILSLGIGYFLTPIKAETSLSTMYGGGGVGVAFPLGTLFSLGVFGHGGYSFNFINTDASLNAGTPYFGGGIVAQVHLGKRWTVDVLGGYRQIYGLTNEVVLSLGATHYLNIKRIKAVDVPVFITSPVFPILKGYYADTPVGSAAIVNTEEGPIKEVEVRYLLPDFSEEPRVCAFLDQIAPGERVTVDLLGNFQGLDASIEREEKRKAVIEVSYKYKLFRYTQRFSGEITVKPAGTIRWDDPGKVSLFVTEEDPAVAAFARDVSEKITSVMVKELDLNRALASGLYTALKELPLVHAEDEETPFALLSADPALDDTLRFPLQVLEEKGGDSVELSILFSSLLESLGIETSFIHYTDKMVCAFKPALQIDENSLLLANGEVKDHNGMYWVAVDVTDLSKGFSEAVKTAKSEWDLAESAGGVTFHPLREGRERYGRGTVPKLPAPKIAVAEELAELYKAEEKTYVQEGIAPQVASLKEKITSTKDIRVRNSLGILLARYGELQKASIELSRATMQQDYVPALINLGHIYYIQEDYVRAQPFYERAYDQAPFDPRVILALAKVNYRLENFGNARRNHEKLESIDPELAEEFSFLKSPYDPNVGIPKEFEEKDVVVWIED